MLNTVEMADTYFATNYFNRDKWKALSTEDKAMLIESAEIDVSMALRCELDPSWAIRTEKPFTPVQMAVFEWAIYLYINKDKLQRRLNSTRREVESVEVEGVGKEVYANAGDNYWYLDCLWSSRAGQFLSMIDRDVRIVR